MSIYTQYKSFYKEKSSKYPNCVILLQIGSFFELYGKDDCIDTNASEIAYKLSIEFVLKDKIKGYKMAGIPIYKYDKYKDILLRLGYTIFKIEQVSDNYICSPNLIFGNANGKLEKRVITEIVSPGTNIDNDKLQNYIVCLYIEKNTNSVSISLATIDISLSNVINVYECDFTEGKNKIIDDITRLLYQFPVSEYIIVTKKNQGPINDILHLLGIHENKVQQMYIEEIVDVTEEASFLLRWSISALKQFLSNRLYSTESLIVEYIPFNNLELTYNCAKQLDLHLLYNLINKCNTPMGSRLLHSRLYKPLSDSILIQESLDSIEIPVGNHLEQKKIFKNLCDFDKIIQGLSKGIITRAKFRRFYDNLMNLVHFPFNVNEILDFINGKILFTDECFKFIGNIQLDELYKKQVNLQIKQQEFIDDIKYSLRKNVKDDEKKKGIIDNLELKIKDNSVVLSHLRAIIVMKDCPGWEYVKKSNETLVTCPEFSTTCKMKSDVNDCILKLEQETFVSFQIEMYNNLGKNLKKISENIQLLDFYHCARDLKEKYKLSKPVLATEKRLVMNGLRHLLVEEYNQEAEYITNDLVFDSEKYGSVIYGCNSSGKSCLLKATGLAVIMAQAGLYVPCESMEFQPLECIMTRIIGGDDIERGKSSFIVELSEISSILHISNDKTLVLVDEASKGSETESASAINYALIKYLVSHKSFFLSTTHLHNLSKDLSNIKEINVFNMRILIDKDSLVFERKLQQGSGIPLYGLEVAKILNFPKDFLDIAFKYRDNHTKRISKSKYNSKSIKISCELCGYFPKNDMDLSLDTHHISFQCNAIDEYNGVYHKNRLSNLVTLCKKCHIKVHSEKITLKPVQTLHGVKFTNP